MAKEKLSLEEQVRQADIDELAKFQQFFDARVARDVISKIYRRSIKEWANAQRRHVKAVHKLERLRQQLNAANQGDHAVSAKSGQSRQHGNSGE